MTKEEFALMLNDRKYGEEITVQEEETAKENGFIVIFGASDDLIEFRGAIYDEIDALEGADIVIAMPGWFMPIGADDDADEDNYIKIDEMTPLVISEDSTGTVNRIYAKWAPIELDCSWLIKTEMPHATFDVREDGWLYCRGIVISVSDLSKSME